MIRLPVALIIALLCISCDHRTDSQFGRCEEKVEDTWKNGVPKRASYFDPGSHDKIGEREFYEDKKTYREWSLSKGRRNGIARSFREDGKPWSLNTYRNDTLHGPYQTWHENGKLYIDGQYDEGRRSGVWRFYGPAGNLFRSVDFDASVNDSLPALPDSQ